MDDWKKFVSADFLMNVAAVLVAMWVWNKFLKNKV